MPENFAFLTPRACQKAAKSRHKHSTYTLDARLGENEVKLFRCRIPKIAMAAFVAASLSVLVSGCANVPRESVDLSYTLGQDLEALHQSHRDLVTRYFDALRTQVNDAIDQVFVPTYVNSFVASGKLVQHAQNQRADLVEAWARLAVKRIDRERRERLGPLYDAERDLLASINEAFDKAVRANAAITAHLASMVKTQQTQDDLLESVKLKGLREKIYSGLADASAKAGRITSDINAANVKLEKVN